MVTEREDYLPFRMNIRTPSRFINLDRYEIIISLSYLIVLILFIGVMITKDDLSSLLEENQHHKIEQYFRTARIVDLNDITLTIKFNNPRALRLALQYARPDIFLSKSINSVVNNLKHAVFNNQTEIVRILLSDDRIITPSHTIDYLLLIGINRGCLEIVELLILSGKFNPSVGGVYTMARAAQEKYDSILRLVFEFDKNGYLVNKDKKILLSDNNYSLACIFKNNGYGHPFNTGCDSQGIISPDQSLLLLYLQIVMAEDTNFLLYI